jgi:hypothetical protein
MDFYEMDTPGVYDSGNRVTDQTSTAAGLAQRFGTVLTTAETTVTHPRMISAIARYHEAWHPQADRVVGQIEALGGNTSASAVTVDAADQEADSHVRVTGGHVDTCTTALRRDINAPTPV